MLNRNNIHHWSEPGNISAPNSANSVVRWAPPLLSMEKGKIKMINKILGHARGGHLRVALGVVSGALRGEGDWRVAPCQCGTGGWVVPVYQLPSTWNLSSIALLHSYSKDVYPRIIWYGEGQLMEVNLETLCMNLTLVSLWRPKSFPLKQLTWGEFALGTSKSANNYWSTLISCHLIHHFSSIRHP